MYTFCSIGKKYDLQSKCNEIVLKILTFKCEKANFIYITFYNVTFLN